VSEPQCNGICLWPSEIGIPMVTANPAYPHPDCPAHGSSDLARMERGELRAPDPACPTCHGSGLAPYNHPCSGCSGVVSPAHEPTCGTQPCPCMHPLTDDERAAQDQYAAERGMTF